ELATRRIVVSTGGPLVEAARAADAPVIGLPGILQPRSAVGYMFVAAAQVAAVVGACPDLAAEVEEAATFLSIHIEDLRAQAAEVVSQMEGGLPVVYGADLTIPVARRWKTQINENAKLPAFFSELPEADHNEICSWVGVGAAGESITVVMLRDADQNQREQRRFELTAEKIVAGGASVVEVVTRGSSRVARMLWGTMLGDLVSVGLAEAHGVDPVEVEAIEQFKVAMGTPRR
ncbi:MAG TPA: SIS domain-containing protein, partial [Solirubrobacterales bacterium]|nr:SIS domain-containing protein [Solirubrobacterales bacterium]